MSYKLTTKPKSFKEVSKEKFYMVNGQYTVEASKQMQTMPQIKTKVEKF